MDLISFGKGAVKVFTLSAIKRKREIIRAKLRKSGLSMEEKIMLREELGEVEMQLKEAERQFEEW